MNGSNPRASRILIMAAGTGGHVIPGLALAQQLRELGHTVRWLGTENGMENRLTAPMQMPMHHVGFDGLRGKGLLGAMLGGWRLVQAFFACLALLRSQRIDAVLGMGGYVCVPGGLAAAILGKPLILVNADSQLLLSNKLLLPFADAICFGFDGADAKRIDKAIVTGNPVRAELASISSPQVRLQARTGPLKLLVVGGSSGARALNVLLPAALALIAADVRPVVLHQCGMAHEAEVRLAYSASSVSAELVPFIHDMARALADCDLIVCRAGAITVSELCATGVASVLVPLVISTTQHQQGNAQWMAEHGAAIHAPQRELTPQALADLLQTTTRERLLELASAAKALAGPDAANRIVRLTLTLVDASAEGTNTKGKA